MGMLKRWWTEEQLAAWLAVRGVGRCRPLWLLVKACSPFVAGLVLTLTELNETDNTLVWYYTEDEDPEGVRSALAWLSERINRAPAPMGLDSYLICLDRLTALPSDDFACGLSEESIDETLSARPIAATHWLEGDRWHDWKRGRGPAETRELLADSAPNRKLPVVVLRVAVTGAGLVRDRQAF